MSKGGYLLKNIGLLTLSNFGSKILVFLLVPLYTSVLSTADYGEFDIYYSLIQVLFPILSLNIADAVMRFALDKDANISQVMRIGFALVTLGAVSAVAMSLAVRAFGLFKGHDDNLGQACVFLLLTPCII